MSSPRFEAAIIARAASVVKRWRAPRVHRAARREGRELPMAGASTRRASDASSSTLRTPSRAFAILCSRRDADDRHRATHRWRAASSIWFDIATAIGDTLFRFVQREGALRSCRTSCACRSGAGGNRFGISHVDHITSNFLTLQPALAWMEQVMGFERHWRSVR